jgi:sugar O-acyltransferase (sialic acid O-acetyltransferase NeuD family)
LASITFIGGGGHALVACDCAAAARVDVAGFYDDASDAPLIAHAKWLGPLEDALDIASPWLLALGDLTTRRRVLRSLDSGAESIIHAGAVVSPTARIGRGVLIGPGAIVNARARIADHAIINSGAVVEHECEVGVNAHIAPGAVLGGRAAVGDDTLIGINAAVLPGVTIGARCTIGAGAVVTRPIENAKTATGAPARPLR